MKVVRDLLEHVLAERKWYVPQLAEAIGVSESKLYRLRKGDMEDVSFGLVLKLLELTEQRPELGLPQSVDERRVFEIVDDRVPQILRDLLAPLIEPGYNASRRVLKEEEGVIESERSMRPPAGDARLMGQELMDNILRTERKRLKKEERRAKDEEESGEIDRQ